MFGLNLDILAKQLNNYLSAQSINHKTGFVKSMLTKIAKCNSKEIKNDFENSIKTKMDAGKFYDFNSLNLALSESCKLY